MNIQPILMKLTSPNGSHLKVYARTGSENPIWKEHGDLITLKVVDNDKKNHFVNITKNTYEKIKNNLKVISCPANKK